MRNHKICKKAILKFNISWRHNINDILMYNVLFVQKSSVYNAILTNFRAKKIRELATKKNFYFLFFFLSICPTYGENLKRIWDYSNSICRFDKELLYTPSYPTPWHNGSASDCLRVRPHSDYSALTRAWAFFAVTWPKSTFLIGWFRRRGLKKRCTLALTL